MAFWPVSIIVPLLMEPVSRAPPMLVIELAVEPRRTFPFAVPYFRWETSGKGNCCGDDVAVGEARFRCGLGVPGEAILTVMGSDVGTASAGEVGCYVQCNGCIRGYLMPRPPGGHDCVRSRDSSEFYELASLQPSTR